MKFLDRVKKSPLYKILTNIFVLFFVPFIIWMLFFDDNSYLVHREFNKEIEDLESTITFYEEKLFLDKEMIKNLQDSLQEITSLKRRLQRLEIILGLSSITVMGFISYRLLKK